MSKTAHTEAAWKAGQRGHGVVRLGKRLPVYRLTALGVLLALFYAWDWMPFRVAQRDAIEWSFCIAGYAPVAFVHEESPAVRVGDHVFFYTAECTYLDLLMIVGPFLWVFGASRRRNILRIAIAALAILGGNLIRTWASVYLNVRGVDWFYTHNLPDYIIWWPMVAVVVLVALRRDLGGRFDSWLNPHAPTRSLRAQDACAQP